MAQTITRKSSGVRRQSRAASGRGKARGNGSLVDPLMRAVPLDEAQWHGLFTALFLVAALVFLYLNTGAADAVDPIVTRVLSLGDSAVP